MYNETYSLQEKQTLSKLNRVLSNADFTEYEQVGNYDILKFGKSQYEFSGHGDDGSSWWSDFPVKVGEHYIAQIICANGGNPVLDIFDTKVRMTPSVAQKCEQLLFEYKLKQKTAKKKLVPDYKKIIKEEQSRDIYKLCTRPKTYGVLNAAKPNIILIDYKDDDITMDGERHIGFNISIKQRILTKLLFAGLKSTDSAVEFNKLDGLYHVYIRAKHSDEVINELAFKSIDQAKRFSSQFNSRLGGVYFNKEAQCFKCKTR